MPEHSPSTEATWLSANYPTLSDYRGIDLRGEWIAVIGEQVVDHDTDPRTLVERVNSSWGRDVALFASVVAEPLG